jgi:hypothetical protein
VRYQLDFFRERGDDVQVYTTQPSTGWPEELEPVVQRATAAQLTQQQEPHFAASDLYVYHYTTAPIGAADLLESLRHLAHGAVILCSHHAVNPSGEVGRLASYADLLVAPDDTAAQALATMAGCAPGAVRVLGAAGSAAEYGMAWALLVAEATAWLPNRPYPYGRLPSLAERQARLATGNPTTMTTFKHHPADSNDWNPVDEALTADLQQLRASAVILPREYVVQSRLPLIGPLIAWVRRNLTSHLREPYLDPILQRQEAYNRLVAQLLPQLAAQPTMPADAAINERLTELETKLTQLTAEVARLRERLSHQLPGDDEHGRIDPDR